MIKDAMIKDAICCANCAHSKNLNDSRVWWYCTIHQEYIEITNICSQYKEIDRTMNDKEFIKHQVDIIMELLTDEGKDKLYKLLKKEREQWVLMEI